MEIVKPTGNLEMLNRNIKDDFYKVPNLKFDIEKMRVDLNIILKKKKFNTLGIKKLWRYIFKSNTWRQFIYRRP